MRSLILSLLLGLLLTGCAETAARFIQEGAYLHRVADAYVREVHEFRQWVRQECRASLIREVDALKLNGDETALREMLARYYPGLVTIGIISDIREDLEGLLAKAPGCE